LELLGYLRRQFLLVLVFNDRQDTAICFLKVVFQLGVLFEEGWRFIYSPIALSCALEIPFGSLENFFLN